MIRDIKITNYRLFDEFEISSLARVNLIVGNNNSGKSSLLEAIHLLTSDEVRASLLYILNERGEIVSGIVDKKYDRGYRIGYQISQIFHNRTIKPGQSASISSTADTKMTLKIVLRDTASSSREGEVGQATLFDEEELMNMGVINRGYVDSLVFERNGTRQDLPNEKLRIEEDVLLAPASLGFRRGMSPKGKSRFLTTNYIGYDELALLWNNITLTPKEDKVVEALQILEPQVDRISFTSNQTSNSGILLRLKDEYEPIPLGSMGDGMRRILAIAASLVSVEKGTLLVDEIDTGLYHGALVDMWRLVLETSSKQNAQVFATTHSWDCVKAFQQALDEYNDPEIGRLIRIEKSATRIKTVPYSANELDIAVEQGIEVR